MGTHGRSGKLGSSALVRQGLLKLEKRGI